MTLPTSEMTPEICNSQFEDVVGVWTCTLPRAHDGNHRGQKANGQQYWTPSGFDAGSNGWPEPATSPPSLDAPAERKRFPIQGERRYPHGERPVTIPPMTIPWSVAEVAFKAYDRQNFNGQTLERLAERGGFGRDEFLDLLRAANND